MTHLTCGDAIEFETVIEETWNAINGQVLVTVSPNGTMETVNANVALSEILFENSDGTQLQPAVSTLGRSAIAGTAGAGATDVVVTASVVEVAVVGAGAVVVGAAAVVVGAGAAVVDAGAVVVGASVVVTPGSAVDVVVLSPQAEMISARAATSGMAVRCFIVMLRLVGLTADGLPPVSL